MKTILLSLLLTLAAFASPVTLQWTPSPDAAVSADFYITPITSAGAGYAAFRMSGSGTLYSTTTYDAFSGTTDQNQDLCFECWGT